MSEETKEKIQFIFSLLKMTIAANRLSVGADDKGHILIFSTDEYLANGKDIKKCKDGIVIDIKNLV